ncbi:unnamed protein product [Alopecurus aequalis]
MVLSAYAMDGAGLGVRYFEWLKPRSPRSPTSESSLLSRDHQAPGRDGEDPSTMLCLPLLGRLGVAVGAQANTTVKEEVSSITEEEAGVDLNIGLPASGAYSSEEEVPPMEMDEDEDEETEEEEEEKPGHERCKVEAGAQVEHTEILVETVAGGEESSNGAAAFCRDRRYWIPTPAQILVGAVQFICHVCSKTFNRCTCGATAGSTARVRSRSRARASRPTRRRCRCCGCRATAARRAAGTTSPTRARGRSRTSARCRRTTGASTAPSPSSAAGAPSPSPSRATGARTRRTAASAGSARAAPTSSTSGRSTTTPAPSAAGTSPSSRPRRPPLRQYRPRSARSASYGSTSAMAPPPGREHDRLIDRVH